jgi:2-polyprenyl-6-methoxyphenol hydroxylase-like FAD-dependent oxidoreductase
MHGNKRRRKTRIGNDAHIVIVGSGLGGLGAAISLEQAGFTNVEIFERDASACARREGFGLTLTYNPKGPLAQMGLLDQVAQRDCPSRSHYIFSVREKVVR